LEHAILSEISGPDDLRELDGRQLERLAEEIRDILITISSRNGGHLAPNLGVVELTIGLHLALKSPKDKIVWDVGHQCYVHKLLTGRAGRFSTLRQYQGISGFPKRSESPHDVFDTGHASNSISVALGLAEARDLSGGDETIVAVIGDGSLTGGISYEALNQAGHLGTHVIVLLNDNEMSIAGNVGAMSSYLARIRLDPTYNKMRDEFESAIRKIPGIGELVFAAGEHMKESFKQLVVPGMIFEEFGFKYVGPIDGHDIDAVKTSIKLAKAVEGPVLIHAITQKGRGYCHAETSPDKFHGISPFVVANGEPKRHGKAPQYTRVFGDTMVDLGRRDERIVALTAAMTAGTGLEGFAEAYPSRFYDVGIAEQHAVTFSAGLALKGFIPVVAVYSTFLQRAYDQVMQDVCLQDLHVVFALDRGGLVGEDGPTHHGVFDISYLRHIPGLTLMSPKDESELRDMLYTAIHHVSGPVAVRYSRGEGEGVQLAEEFTPIPIGQAEILADGQDVCLLALGRMVGVARKAAAMLEDEGISCTVANARFVKPLDSAAILDAARSHRLLVTIEENALPGGFGSAVGELLLDSRVEIEIARLGIPDRFITHGTQTQLLEEVGLSPEDVVKAVERRLAPVLHEKGAS